MYLDGIKTDTPARAAATVLQGGVVDAIIIYSLIRSVVVIRLTAISTRMETEREMNNQNKRKEIGDGEIKRIFRLALRKSP